MIMYSYIKGKIVDIESNYIVLENNDIGYLIYTANPYSFELNTETIIYLYQYVREDELSLYGFKTKEEKSMFLKLIEVKGLGCKMALPMIANGAVDGIVNAIESENINYLKKFPKIGDKVARQIILDLKGKLVSSQTETTDHNNEELMEALKSLGYRPADIKKVLTNVSKSGTIESQIKEALKLLMR